MQGDVIKIWWSMPLNCEALALKQEALKWSVPGLNWVHAEDQIKQS